VKTGTVKFYNEAKGYGFIAPDGSDEDVFVHISAVRKARLELEPGERLRFDVERTPRGVRAVNLVAA
jgi:CspA family cold shock protein